DPTMNSLEKRAAEVVGKEAAVYVASGMLGNLCGVLSQTERGDEVILGDLAHIYQNEMGASFVVGSIVPRLVPNREGCPSLDDVTAAIRPAGMYPRTSLVCLENSHNNCGGAVLTVAETAAVAEMRGRLGDDHRNAKAFAEGLARIPGIRIDAHRVVTNIVSFEVDADFTDAAAFQKSCAERGLRVSRYLGNSPRLRAVTHYGIERSDIDDALAIIETVMSGARTPVAAGD